MKAPSSVTVYAKQFAIALFVLTLAGIAITGPASATRIGMGNWSVTPHEIYPGDTVKTSFEIWWFEVEHKGNFSAKFTTDLQNAEWEYSLDVNGNDKGQYRITGSPAYSPLPPTPFQEGDTLHMVVHLTVVAPPVTQKTSVSLAKVEGFKDSWSFGSGEGYMFILPKPVTP